MSLEPFTTVASQAVVLREADIDTDVIFPARFLLHTEKRGLGRFAFYERRYRDGAPVADFPLNRPEAAAARILVAGPNFGCGSSREQAVWALHDLNLRVVIAPSFGEIFRSNAFKSGLLPVTLPADAVTGLMAVEGAITVDLQTCTVTAPGLPPFAFEVEDWRREALLNGWDEVLVLLNTRLDAIAMFESRRRTEAPWLFAPLALEGL